MKPPKHTAHTFATNPLPSLSPSQQRSAEQNHGHGDMLDQALHFLIQREELLLGDALNQCNQLLEESRQQAEEIKEFFDEDE